MTTVPRSTAYFNDEKLKEKIVAQVLGHQEADEIIKGQYWEDGKGCAVGCITHTDIDDNPHEALEAMTGIPEWCAHLIEGLFEGLPNEEAKKFPLAFVEAVPVGFDKWDELRHDFLAWLLMDSEHGVIQYSAGLPDVEKAIKEVAKLHSERCEDEAKWKADRFAAYAAADAAAYAADRFAAYAAAYAARKAQADKLISLLKEGES